MFEANRVGFGGVGDHMLGAEHERISEVERVGPRPAGEQRIAFRRGAITDVEFFGAYKLVYDGDPARPGGLSGGKQTYRDGTMRPGITPLVPCK